MKKATLSKSARIKKSYWVILDDTFRLEEDVDHFYHEWKSKSIKVFGNATTGELKFFDKGVVEQRGSQAIIDELNKE